MQAAWPQSLGLKIQTIDGIDPSSTALPTIQNPAPYTLISTLRRTGVHHVASPKHFGWASKRRNASPLYRPIQLQAVRLKVLDRYLSFSIQVLAVLCACGVGHVFSCISQIPVFPRKYAPHLFRGCDVLTLSIFGICDTPPHYKDSQIRK